MEPEIHLCTGLYWGHWPEGDDDGWPAYPPGWTAPLFGELMALSKDDLVLVYERGEQVSRIAIKRRGTKENDYVVHFWVNNHGIFCEPYLRWRQPSSAKESHE